MSSYSFVNTDTVVFTLTDAKYLASKVYADLKRMQRFYGEPSEMHLADLLNELTGLLHNGYLDTITYGFKKNGNWVTPTLRYTAQDIVASDSVDDDPGKIPPGADISGASFHSFLVTSSKYNSLSESEKSGFADRVGVRRTGAPAPGVEGYFSSDLSYSSGSRALNRSAVKKY